MALFAAALLIAGLQSSAAEPAPPPEPPEVAEQESELENPAAEEPKVCKTEKITGTRISRSRKVCMTQSEWDALARAAREDLDRLNGPRTNPCLEDRC